ncbi:hypothetical protein GKE73_12900 [Paludibacterium sp. dN 18-1]|uniref:Transposase n=1 Tax=Paludibacterium denitrificans TaxID=2675226 RepID=A0A844GFE4_9NEIS|nr:hypothetical protein [Paludibacterium denitrificans]
MSNPHSPKYQTINWQTYNQSLKPRGQLLLWLDKGMTLHLPVDSTSIKMMGEGEWRVKKHGADYRPNGQSCIWV